MKNKSVLAYPYFVWSIIFIVIPLLLILFFSFTKNIGGNYVFTFDNYRDVISPIYMKVFSRSLFLAGIATILCLLIGYPVAFIISKMNINKRGRVILLFILPMWMNFLLRTYSWVAILGKSGLLNTILKHIGIAPIDILYTNTAVLLGMIYNFIPFMVLPIYTVLSKMDDDLINAAYDLGANNFMVFKKIIFPLSLSGVFSGIIMVFMPAVTTFAISSLLGGGKVMLVGDLIQQQFTVVGDWSFGSAISMFMMIIILIFMAVMSKFGDDSDKEGGGFLF